MYLKMSTAKRASDEAATLEGQARLLRGAARTAREERIAGQRSREASHRRYHADILLAELDGLSRRNTVFLSLFSWRFHHPSGMLTGIG